MRKWIDINEVEEIKLEEINARQLSSFSKDQFPRCQGKYVMPHPAAGKRCVSQSRYMIDNKYYCTKHAKEEALRMILSLSNESTDTNKLELKQ